MKNKILPIFCLFILFNFVFINNIAFAYTPTENIVCIEPTNTYLPTALEELQKTYPEEDYYYTYGYAYAFRCYALCFFEKQYLKITPYIYYSDYTYETHDYYNVKVSNDGTDVPVIIYNVYDNYYSFYCNSTYDDFVSAFSIPIDSTDGVEFTANFNIYTNSSYTGFFFNTPVTGTLAPILEKVEMMEPTMKEILILVPTILILIASYLGLRKGLTFIKTLKKM